MILYIKWIYGRGRNHIAIEHSFRFGIDQFVGDAEDISRDLQAAGDHHRHSEFLARLIDGGDTARPNLAGRNHLEVVPFRKPGEAHGERLGQPQGGCLVAAQSREGQHYDMFQRRWRDFRWRLETWKAQYTTGHRRTGQCAQESKDHHSDQDISAHEFAARRVPLTRERVQVSKQICGCRISFGRVLGEQFGCNQHKAFGSLGVEFM